MKTKFLCPKCKSDLYISKHIVLTARNRKGNSGLIFLSPKLGDYHITVHPDFNIEEGERTDFFCPVCHKNLAAKEFKENFAKVLMIDEDNDEYEILFSEVAGERCTYKIQDSKIEMFGENAQKYMNYFGEVPKY